MRRLDRHPSPSISAEYILGYSVGAHAGGGCLSSGKRYGFLCS